MRALPVMTGVLTVAMLGGIGFSLFSSGAQLWGGLIIGLAVLRLVLLIGQIQRRRQADRNDPGS